MSDNFIDQEKKRMLPAELAKELKHMQIVDGAVNQVLKEITLIKDMHEVKSKAKKK